ncbi:MAG: patatin family protein [Tissierellia bacterium]|nr:patatin family protein [Tissierellia bacterium]
MKNNIFKTALIFEGGGMRASFSSGIVNTLLKNQIYFNYLAGISAGSSCVVNYLSRDIERTKASFVDFVKDPEFGNWLTFINGRGLFNAKYIYQESCLPGKRLPYDFDSYMNNPADFDIGAYNMTSSKLVYFGREDIKDRNDLMLAVRASSSLPVFMPSVDIKGEKYIDGGVAGGIPIDIAIEKGYSKLLIVLTRERGYRKSPPSKKRMIKALFRKYPKTAEAILTRYIRYNQTLDKIRDLESQGRAFVIYPDRMPIGNKERDIDKLEAMYQLGISQGRRMLKDIEEFIRE